MDPREILREAGIECPEVVNALNTLERYGRRECPALSSECDGAILALAKLAAKWKWQLRLAAVALVDPENRYYSDEDGLCTRPEQVLADLDARWEARDE